MPAYDVVREFEETIAAWAGAKYGVAVESCTAALFLSLQYRSAHGRSVVGADVSIPKNTYLSVAMSIMHSGGNVVFDGKWEGSGYWLEPFSIFDGALMFHRSMFMGGLHCLSFHAKKILNIGLGGMILTDDAEAVRWLKLMRFDGREECALSEQKDFTVLGYHYPMLPETASRGLMLFDFIKDKDLPDLRVEDQGYANLDLSAFPIFRKVTA